MKTFWNKLDKPFFVLAPMANVTDSVFRKLFAKYGKPDVTWTEFVSADGLVSPGRERLLIDLDYSRKERPIVAQLFTGHPLAMKKAAALARVLGFDGVDINMGCPDRAVEKQGGGAGMIKNPKTAIEVLEAARSGWIGDNEARMSDILVPVSVKTRLGYNSVDLGWIRLLLEQKLPVLTVHLRTRKEMSEVAAHWELMPEIVKLRNEISPETLIIGNGDVDSLEAAREKCQKYGCDGVMIGRGIFGKPWFFEGMHDTDPRIARMPRTEDKSPEFRLKVLLEHTKAFEKAYCGKKRLKSFAVMKKHFKAYVNGWDNAKDLRAQLMETNSYKEVEKIIKDYLKNK